MQSVLIPLALVLLLLGSVPSPTQATPTVDTYWLDNDLRVVEVTVDATATAGIRLVVESGHLRVSPEQYQVPHLVEHLVFADIQATPDLDSRFRRAGGLSNGFTDDFSVVHEFDVPDSLAAYVLRTMRRQWDEPFTDALVELERERVQHEVCAAREMSKLDELADRVRPEWEHRRWHRDIVDRIFMHQTPELWSHFQEVYVGKRLTLLVAADRATLASLRPAIQQFATLPAGTAATPAKHGDLSWMQELVDSRGPFQLNYVGMWFPRLATGDVGERLWLQDAVAEYMDTQLAQKQPVSYGFDHALYVAKER